MKFFPILTICLLFLFGSCKKTSNVDPVNTMSATIDGVNVNFNSFANAQLVKDPTDLTTTTLSINGSSGPDDKESIAVSITSHNSSIVSGTFLSSDTGNELVFPSIIYHKKDSTLRLPPVYLTNNFQPGSTTVTITSISSTNVQGTFSGTLVDPLDRFIIAPKTVTNGKFSLAIK
jgi:hypothetical protein